MAHLFIERFCYSIASKIYLPIEIRVLQIVNHPKVLKTVYQRLYRDTPSFF